MSGFGPCPTAACRRTANTTAPRVWPASPRADRQCGGGVQTRARTMLTQGNAQGKQCPTNAWYNSEWYEVLVQQSSVPDRLRVERLEHVEPCSATCGGGWQSRTQRVAREARFGGTHCAPTYENKRGETACDIACKFTEWSAWSPSHSCGTDGVERRHRSVKQDNAGATCAQDNEPTQTSPCGHHVPARLRGVLWGTFTTAP